MYSVQKYYVVLFFMLSITFALVQTLEDEVAQKSCECIQSKVSQAGAISKAEIQKCISESGDAVF
ncbi:MAG: hypothetical protein L6262_10870 [Weeksellaceae bacterium]|nr:hypothetical protein [Weeksellaceae bacterium]